MLLYAKDLLRLLHDAYPTMGGRHHSLTLGDDGILQIDVWKNDHTGLPLAHTFRFDSENDLSETPGEIFKEIEWALEGKPTH